MSEQGERLGAGSALGYGLERRRRAEELFVLAVMRGDVASELAYLDEIEASQKLAKGSDGTGVRLD